MKKLISLAVAITVALVCMEPRPAVALTEDGTATWSVATAQVQPPAAAASDDAPRATESFKTTLGKAATEAYREGKISRLQLAQVRTTIWLRPRVLSEVQAVVVDEGEKAGRIQPGAGVNPKFDWNALLEFIKELLPIIMSIISMFGVVVPLRLFRQAA